MSRKWIVAYFICMHLLLITLIINPNALIYINTIFKVTQSEFTPYYKEMLSFHQRVDNNLPKNSVIFLGDSITQGLAVSAISSVAVNYGIGGDTTVGVLQRIPNYHSIPNARVIIITIGHNDFKYRKLHVIYNNILKIINMIPSNIPIVLYTLFPVNERKGISYINNKEIIKLNQKILTIPQKHKNVYTADLFKRFSDYNNNLKNKFHIGDGVHLSKLGYDVWIQHLKTQLLKTSKQHNAKN